MSGNDLIRPLGQATRRSRRPIVIVAAAVVVFAAAGALAVHYLPAVHGPTATAVINARPSQPAIPPPPPTPPEPATLTDITPRAETPPAPAGTVVVHDASEPEVITIPGTPAPDSAVAQNPKPTAEGKPLAFPDPELIEASSYGPLPRISATGSRPLEAYARPVNAPATAVRIAIVVGGLGIDKDSTAKAIASLPADVSLAFAPYDPTMTADVNAAHAAGHELLLQVPLEPFNYPAINPGKNTLTTDASEDENRNRLRWLLGRMTGYVGVVNYLGARFTADQQAMTPVLRELASRGVLYLDDGSSPRSATEAAAGRAPFLRADMVLDTDVSSDAINAQLAALESIARARGFAIATATAFPQTVDAIAAFADAAAAKGIVLVPLTALLTAHS
jgi:polysaccharide deacetylase 2 family uncharacterized protein YibQ